MKILVTGGAGFLGSHLCADLLEKGNSVIALDNLSTGDLTRIEPLKSNQLFEFINMDVREPLQFDVDGIFNFACPASPVQYQLNPVDTITTSFIGAANVLSLANKMNCKVLQASTSEVYGDPNISPQKEEYWGNVNPIGIRACYDEGKRAAETLFFDNWREHGTKIRVARIFNTYGPGMQFNDGRVVSNFIHQALRNADITIYGDGSQTRSFCYVSDLIDGITRYFFSKSVEPGPINLGNPQEMTIFRLANLIIKLSNSNSRIVMRELPSDDPKQRKPDISKALSNLNWKPKVEIEQGLSLTIADFEKRLR